MVDFQRVHDCFSKAASSYYDDAVMQSKMASRLIDLICHDLPVQDCHRLTQDGNSIAQNAPSCTQDGPSCNQDDHAKQGASGYKVLEIGCGPGNFTTQLLNKLSIQELCLNDLSAQMLKQNMLNLYEQGYIGSEQQIFSIHGNKSEWLNQSLSSFDKSAYQSGSYKIQNFRAICGDARLLSTLKTGSDFFSPSFDLIVSNASFQWFENLAAALEGFKQLSRQKSKDIHTTNASCGSGCSLLAFSSFYAGHFAEVKELTDVGLIYLTKEKVIEALESCQLDYQVYFDKELQYFNSSVELFRHLHETGVNGIATTPLSAGSLRRIMREYEERFSDERGVRLTWHPYYVIAKLH